MTITSAQHLEVVPGRKLPFLLHAQQDAEASGLYDFPVVDVDSHIADLGDLRKFISYIRNPNFARAFEKYNEVDLRRLFLDWNIGDRAIAGRSKTYGTWDDLPEEIPEGMPRTVASTIQFMDRAGIDYLVSFPTLMLSIGASPQPEMQTEMAWAFNTWLAEDVVPWDERIQVMPYLPVSDPAAALRIVSHFAERRNVVGWMITGVRTEPLHRSEFLPLWSAINDIGKPVAFHSGPNWKERPFEVMGRFFGAHGLGFSFYSMVHMANIVLSGLAERFPGIRWIFIESGQSWVPFMMARLDDQYRKRSSEAPLLQRLPSEYIRDMYFTTQPFEDHADNPDVGRAIFDVSNGMHSWLFASDYPHHDFDLPGMVYNLSYLSEEEKRAVLGGNALKLFGLPDATPTRTRRLAARR